ncbi:hypothetical protein PAMP_023116 [Pampus punctatissimus]
MIRGGLCVRISAMVGYHGRRPVTDFCVLASKSWLEVIYGRGWGWFDFPSVQSHLVAAVAPPRVSAASPSSGVGSGAPLAAERRPFHGAVVGGVLPVAATKLVVAVSTTITSLVAIATTPIRSGVTSASVAAVVASAISVVVVSAVVSAAVAILIPPHASAWSASRRHAGSVGRLHLLLGQGFLHLNLVSIDGVELHHHRLVGRVVVGEVNKAEAPFLPGLLLRDDFGLFYLAVLREILAQVLLLDVVFQAADEDFLHLSEGLRFVRVLSRHGPLHFDGVSIDGVRPGRHRRVGLLRCGVGDKAEAAGPLQLLVHHHHAVGQRTVLLEMLAQAIVVGVHI